MKTALKTESKSMAWYAGMSLIMFGFIFEFYLHAFGIPISITPSRIAAATITILAVYKTRRKKNKKIMEGVPYKTFRKFCWFHVPIFLYMFLLYVIIGVQGDSRHMFTILIHAFVFRFLPIWAFYVCFDTFDELMKVLVLTMLIQTGFIWLCITEPSIKFFIDNTFHLSETYLYYGDTYAGGLGCITSQGLIRYAVGEVACVYLYFKKNNIVYVIYLLLFGLTGAMVARTGLIVIAICVCFILYYVLKKRRMVIFSSLFVSVILTVLIANSVLNSNSSRKFLEDRFLRMAFLFENVRTANHIYDITFFDKYMHDEASVLPSISSETIIGSGVPSGTSGNGITVTIDGGFFRLYVAYGLILCIIFYFFFFTLLLKVCHSFISKEIRYTMYLMLVLIVIGEFKEWNIYSSCHVTFFFLMALLAYHDDKKEKVIQYAKYS